MESREWANQRTLELHASVRGNDGLARWSWVYASRGRSRRLPRTMTMPVIAARQRVGCGWFARGEERFLGDVGREVDRARRAWRETEPKAREEALPLEDDRDVAAHVSAWARNSSRVDDRPILMLPLVVQLALFFLWIGRAIVRAFEEIEESGALVHGDDTAGWKAAECHRWSTRGTFGRQNLFLESRANDSRSEFITK